MQPGQPPRYEFRVFGDDLSGFARDLAAAAADSSRTRGTEFYIASRLTIDASVKLRDDRLEVKRLLAREGLLEQWAPSFAKALPVEGEELANEALALLGVDPGTPQTFTLGRQAILGLIRAQPGLAVVEVTKDRTRHTLAGGAFAEHVRLTADARSMQSVAVEAGDPDTAGSLVKRFGLAPMLNESYPALMQRLAFLQTRD